MSTDPTPAYDIEVVHSRLNEGVDPKSFLETSRIVGREFSAAQPGFLKREIGSNDDGTSLILVWWKTADDARNSISRIETVPDIVQTYMSGIDRATITRSLFEVL